MNKVKTFSHSGTMGDTLCAMVAVKILGGGDVYLKLGNLKKMIQEKLGWPDAGRHNDKMRQIDYDQMRDFMLHQPYINRFEVWNGEDIDHELENAALHLETGFFPRNFSNQHALAHNINTDYHFRQLQIDPWMECREERKFPGRPIVVHRNLNYQDGNEKESKTWKNICQRGLSESGVFVGSEEEHNGFEEIFKIRIPHYRTEDLMELARVIQGSEYFITSMGGPSALALSLGKTMMLEVRKNEPFERLEINYPYRLNISYF
jgi:hypothetical protein